METTRQRKARERAAHRAMMARNRAEGEQHDARGTCPQCARPLAHNNSLPGVVWLQCLPPSSVYPERAGCGWQHLYDREA